MARNSSSAHRGSGVGGLVANEEAAKGQERSGAGGQVNYFPFHVGDYAAHTAHLEPMEDLAYRRMLDAYYLREGPLPVSVIEVARLIRLRQFQAEIQAVLSEFFAETAEGWQHTRCDEEIARMQDKQAKARASAAASVNARRASAQRTLNDRSTDVELPTPTPTPTPTPKKEEKREDEPPHGEIIQVFGEELPMARQPRGWNDARKALLRARWFEDEKRQTVEWWREFFRYIAKSDFLCGRNNTPGRAPFVLSLDWLCNSTNFLKVLEGSYES